MRGRRERQIQGQGLVSEPGADRQGKGGVYGGGNTRERPSWKQGLETRAVPGWGDGQEKEPAPIQSYPLLHKTPLSPVLLQALCWLMLGIQW